MKDHQARSNSLNLESCSNYRFNRETKIMKECRAKKLFASLMSSYKKGSGFKGSQKNSKNLGSMVEEFSSLNTVESLTDSSQLTGYFSQKLKPFVRIPKEEKLDEENPVDLTKKGEAEELVDDKLEEKIIRLPLETLEEAKSSSSLSKALVKVMQSKKDDELAPIVKIINSNLQGYIENENTCYVVKFILKRNETTMKKTHNLVGNKLEEMLFTVHTCRLVYTMCNHSQRFRDLLLLTFKSKLLKLLGTVSGAILLSLLISNTPDITNFDFMLQELRKNPEVIKTPYFSRAFATYMTKCSMETLREISKLLTKHFSFLLQDNYGNYLLQIFYERDCQAGIDCCNQILKKMSRRAFLRKYCRYVLFRALEHRAGSNLARELLEIATEEPTSIESVLFKKFSQELLLFTLSKVDTKCHLKVFLEKILHINCAKSTIPRNPSSTSSELVHDLSILKKFVQSE